MKISVASDHAGFDVKEELIDYLQSLGHEVVDYGCDSSESCDYPDYAHPASDAVSTGECDRGVLVCGSALGMVITANRHPGVRAFYCSDSEQAEMSRKHNNSNVICFAARRDDPSDMKEWLDIWFDTPFDGGRHDRRIKKIDRESVRVENS